MFLILGVLTSIGLILACAAPFIRVARGAPAPLVLPIAVGLGVLLLAFLGLIVALVPWHKGVSAAILLICIGGYFVARGWRELRAILDAGARIGLLFWIALSLAAAAFVLRVPAQPAVLPDGPYVFKQWVWPVQVQRLANDLPADNALPAVAAEFMARGLSFKEVRPLMPGQEVSNRPLLMALAALPLRVLVAPVESATEVKSFEYVGTRWPDTLGLVSDRAFGAFLSVAIPLNAAVALAVVALMQCLKLQSTALAGAALVLSSPYVLLHTFFTWPKNLAAFFIIVALTLLATRSRAYALIGVLLGLAYLAHPFAIAYAGCAALGAFFLAERTSSRWASLQLPLAFALMVSPWMIWTRYLLAIDADLVAQNFMHAGPLKDFIWTRIANAAVTLLPTAFTAASFDASTFVRTHLINITSVLGFVWVLLPLLLVRVSSSASVQHPLNVPVLAGLALVPGILLIGVFSYPAVPLLHGWQAASLMLGTLALKAAEAALGLRVTRITLCVQLFFNVLFIALWLRVT